MAELPRNAAVPDTGRPAARPAARWPRRVWIIVLALAFGGALVAGALHIRRAGQQRAERQRGLDLALEGRIAEAEPLLLRAYERDRGDVEVVRTLALGQKELGRLPVEAEPYLTRWCQLEPDNPQAFRLRLLLWMKLQRQDEAVADARRLLELRPGDQEVRQSVAFLLLVGGRPAEALRECRRALRSRPNDPRLRYLLARIYHVRGDRARAEAALDALLAERPGYTEALLLRGILHAEADHPGKAAPLLRRVVAQDSNPQNRQTARYHLGQALARLGKAGEAHAVLAQMQRAQALDRLLKDCEQQPGNLDLHVKAAGDLLEAGRPAEAAGLLRHVLARDPGHPGARRLLARAGLPFRSQGSGVKGQQDGY
jgi:predicted Zn-dependent protease